MKFRTTIATVIAVGLLAGSTVGVAAQDAEVDPMAPAFVTGTLASHSMYSNGTTTVVDGGLLIDGVGFNDRWEASDPRLNGFSTYTGNWQQYSDFMQVEAGTRVVENDDGRWVGTATLLAGHSDGAGINTDTIIMQGEDAYEGLTAYVVMDRTAEPITFKAAIFPGDMPEFPPAE